jgi:hypothetical protein
VLLSRSDFRRRCTRWDSGAQIVSDLKKKKTHVLEVGEHFFFSKIDFSIHDHFIKKTHLNPLQQLKHLLFAKISTIWSCSKLYWKCWKMKGERRRRFVRDNDGLLYTLTVSGKNIWTENIYFLMVCYRVESLSTVINYLTHCGRVVRCKSTQASARRLS